MSPDIEFDYNTSMFTPPAPAVLAEWRSPANPNAPNPERLPGLIDSGADGCVIPQNMIDSLRLNKVDEVWAAGYDGKEKLQPVYSVHLTIPPLKPLIIKATPKDPEDYAIIGRDIINTWLLTLDGPRLKAYLKSTD